MHRGEERALGESLPFAQVQRSRCATSSLDFRRGSCRSAYNQTWEEDQPWVLAGAAATVAGLLSNGATGADPPNADLAAALTRFRASIPSNFDRTYVENAVIPFFLTSIYEGERPALPMIDVTLSKENALPHDLWGLIYQGWKTTPEDGVTVFLQGLEQRGENNLRKRIYMSALTPDLYPPIESGTGSDRP